MSLPLHHKNLALERYRFENVSRTTAAYVHPTLIRGSRAAVSSTSGNPGGCGDYESLASHFNEDLWYSPDVHREDEVERKAARSLAAKVGRIVGAKPFPAAANKLGELTRDAECRLEPVIKVLESDPALSTKLLRLVNSAGFALRTPCSSVAHAANLVGVQRLHQLAQTAAVLDFVDSTSVVAAQVLEHASIVASLCRYLAGHLGLPPEELFTCGFLHDIGKVMLLESEGEPYRQIIEQSLAEPDTAHVRERALLGYDHAILGGHVLAAWNIPAPVPRVVAWHHQVARAYEEAPALSRTINALRLADAASTALFQPQPELELQRLARTEAASYLEISEAQLAAMWDEMLALAVRARAAYRGEPVPEVVKPTAHSQPTSRHQPMPTPTLAEAPDAPSNFPCVVCGVPTYANTCRACGGYVCPVHQHGDDEWCSLCVSQYESLKLQVPPWAYSILGGAVGAMLVGTFLGSSGGLAAPLSVVVAPGLVAVLLLVALGVWQRWLRRLWFSRTCPNRRSLAPPVGDSADALAELRAVSGPLGQRWVNPFDDEAPVIRDKAEPVADEAPPPPLSVRPRRRERLASLRPSLRVENGDRAALDRLVQAQLPASLRPPRPTPSLPPPQSDFPAPTTAATLHSMRSASLRSPSITPSVEAFDDLWESDD